jgi:hypothetical protein
MFVPEVCEDLFAGVFFDDSDEDDVDEGCGEVRSREYPRCLADCRREELVSGAEEDFPGSGGTLLWGTGALVKVCG